MIQARDALVAPRCREKLDALDSEARAIVSGLIERILHEPSDCEIGEPHQMLSHGYSVLYEIDRDLVAQITTFRQLGTGYPYAM